MATSLLYELLPTYMEVEERRHVLAKQITRMIFIMALNNYVDILGQSYFIGLHFGLCILFKNNL